MSLDGSRLVVQGDDPDTLELHDGEDGRHLETLVVFDERDRRAGLDAAATSISMFGGVALSRDGGTLVVASLAKTVAIDVDTRKRVFETKDATPPLRFHRMGGGSRAVVATPCSRTCGGAGSSQPSVDRIGEQHPRPRVLR